MNCPGCDHPVVEHSSEPGVGCLHIVYETPLNTWRTTCPCLRPGTSQADQ